MRVPIEPRGSLTIADLRTGFRMARTLPGLLRRPIGRDESGAILRARLARREADFLAFVGRAVFDNARSPYRALLRLAGCEAGDLARLVARDGIEGALRALLRHGVYLTVDEFKGRRPAVRGGTTIPTDPDALRNPGMEAHVVTRSGGSRGPAQPVAVSLRCWRDRAVDTGLFLHARGGASWEHASWAVPGGSAIAMLLRLAFVGMRPVRWFSQVDPAAAGLHPRYRWSARLLHWGGRIAGVPLPAPEHVPVDDPTPIARWAAEVLARGGTPHLVTFASASVRVCQAARAAGLSLAGARFTVSGEPVTAARFAQVRAAGAEIVPYYAANPCGHIAYGCLAPTAPDEVHLLHDQHALVQAGADGAGRGLTPAGLWITSLLPTNPVVVFNVSLGDEAELGRRACGCPLAGLGWDVHLTRVRSVEKLTAGGMTFLGTDVIRVLEEVLPARFGGGPMDYQLVEDEGPDGRPRLRLLVDPDVGPIEPGAVADVFLAALGAADGAAQVMERVWRQDMLLVVERGRPRSTEAGKLLHLHLATAT